MIGQVVVKEQEQRWNIILSQMYSKPASKIRQVRTAKNFRVLRNTQSMMKMLSMDDEQLLNETER